MAYAVREGVAAGEVKAASEEFTVNLPTGIVSGELLVIFVTADNKTEGHTWPSGWTEQLDYSQSNHVNWAVGTRVADGTEGSTLTIGQNTERDNNYIAARYSGAGAVTFSGRVSGESTAANPPSVTAAGGAGDNLFCTVIGLRNNSGADAVTTLPTGYGNETTNGTGDDAPGLSLSEKESTSATDNPAAATNPDEKWGTFTFVIEPAAGGSTDALLANDVESASNVTSPAVGQEHGLTATSVQSTSNVTTPAVGQAHALLAADVESASEKGSPAVGQEHALLADDVESASEVSTPAVGESNVLLADNVESASEVTSPTVGQTHVLLADDAESASETSSPVLGQEHALLADDAESASEVTTPTASEINILLAEDVESASEVIAPTVGQTHVLLADDAESASETSTPVIGQSHILVSVSIESLTEVATPSLDSGAPHSDRINTPASLARLATPAASARQVTPAARGSSITP